MVRWSPPILVLFMLALSPSLAWPQSRIKDLTTLENSGQAALVGTGMIMGLAGTGDNGQDRAAVMITAQLQPGTLAGSSFDVTVLALGNARTLRGGSLLPTPLKGGNGQVWAIAQGPLYLEGGPGMRASGTIPGGGVLQQDTPSPLSGADDQIRLMLTAPDFTTAKRIADTINTATGQKIAHMNDNTIITLTIPHDYPDGAAGLIAAVEGLSVTPDQGSNRIIINAQTGTIVAGLDIPVAASAISHGDLTIRIHNSPNPARSTIDISDASGQIITSAAGGTVGSLLSTLRASGLNTRDQISVLYALHSAGAITAEIISR